MFVFYDTETTGTIRDFDQILQFAAILTGDDLAEVDRFDIRCRLLPWVVPAPMALKVTGIRPATLTDPSLPGFYDMMSRVRARLEAWSPARFIGYNSLRFDEALLQRAFWQTLHPAYLTVMNGNARMDLFPLVQAASHLAPGALAHPVTDKGKPGFRLDALAPLNGFAHERAHDALGDVEATIHIARLLKTRAPDLWNTAARRAPKQETARLLQPGAPVLVAEYFSGAPSLWWGQRLDQNGASGTSAVMARLGADWAGLRTAGEDTLRNALTRSPGPLRDIGLNKSPIVYSEEEALAFWKIRPDDQSLTSSEALKSDPDFCARLLRLKADTEPAWPEAEHLEQRIFEAFPDRADAALMERFHKSDWPGRADLVRQFKDARYRQLAQRIVYDGAPETLSGDDRRRITQAVAERLFANHDDRTLWRSIAAARLELESMESSEETRLISAWLEALAGQHPPQS
jgi:exodeoxyribonuclease-1